MIERDEPRVRLAICVGKPTLSVIQVEVHPVIHEADSLGDPSRGPVDLSYPRDDRYRGIHPVGRINSRTGEFLRITVALNGSVEPIAEIPGTRAMPLYSADPDCHIVAEASDRPIAQAVCRPARRRALKKAPGRREREMT